MITCDICSKAKSVESFYANRQPCKECKCLVQKQRLALKALCEGRILAKQVEYLPEDKRSEAILQLQEKKTKRKEYSQEYMKRRGELFAACREHFQKDRFTEAEVQEFFGGPGKPNIVEDAEKDVQLIIKHTAQLDREKKKFNKAKVDNTEKFKRKVEQRQQVDRNRANEERVVRQKLTQAEKLTPKEEKLEHRLQGKKEAFKRIPEHQPGKDDPVIVTKAQELANKNPDKTLQEMIEIVYDSWKLSATKRYEVLRKFDPEDVERRRLY